MKQNILLFGLMVAFTIIAAGCSETDPGSEFLENRVYISTDNKVNTVLVKPDMPIEVTKGIKAVLAKPAEEEIELTYKADPSLLEAYKKSYYDENVVILPSDFYTFTKPKAIIGKGSIRSTEAELTLKNIKALDTEQTYILPVRLENAGSMPILESGRTIYYIFKEAALINTVANLEKNFCVVTWNTPNLVSSMNRFTMEALVYSRAWAREGSDSDICSIMGIEGHILLRTGDDFYPGQLQVATPNQKLPGKDATKVLPLNEWVHLAVTFDGAAKKLKVYVNGVLQSETDINYDSFNLTKIGGEGNEHGFCIGRSWNDNRWWPGEISECRVWNKVLTEEDINSRNHFYYVDPSSEGLVAYWKFNEGDGVVINDQTGNGNHAKGQSKIVWQSVELPLKQK